MDVQTENTDPPPNESQPSGKIRKGFKLFGKRKPSNIFSIRGKGDGNNKSPVISSKPSDGLSESPAPNSDTDKENGQEVGQGEREQPEDETLGEDGVLASAPARTSISSASSAKSLGFLSLLRGGRRGAGDRRVHTVSQPVGRQRRGLKGLFGNVKFRSKDKEEKEEAPPSPLLQSSRANSVEIIKEDLTLTPKCQPRSLDSPETESCDKVQSSSTDISAGLPPSESSPAQETTGSLKKTKERMAPSPTSELPLPGDNSLSSLLADISSLLTFDSISGGDIMADVEAEWGKASSAISTVLTDVSPSSFFSKSTISSPPTFTTFSSAATVKPSSVAVSSSSSFKPDTNVTTFTKPSILTSYSVKLSSDSAPDSSTSVQDTTKPSTAVSASATSSKTTYSTSSFTSTAAAMNKAPSVCPGKPDSETEPPRQNPASVSKPASVSPAMSAKPPTVTPSPPVPVTQPPPVLLETVSRSSLEKTTSSKTSDISAAQESRVLKSAAPTCVVPAKPPSPAPVIQSKMTTVPTTAPPSGSVSKAPLSSVAPDSNKTSPSFVTDSSPFPTFTATTKTQPGPASVPAPSSTSSDKIPPMAKPTAPVSLDKTPPPYTPIPAANTQAVSTASSTPTASGQISISASAAPPSPAQIQTSVSKEVTAAAQIQVSQSKVSPSPAQVPVSVSKDPSALIKMQVPSSKAPSSPVEMFVSVSKPPLATAQITELISANSPAPVSFQVPASKPPPASAHIQVLQPKSDAPTTATSPPSPPMPWPSDAPAKMRVAGQASLDHQQASSNGTGVTGSQAVPPKAKELPAEPQASLQGPAKDKRPTQSKAAGLSKIPVVGGGRVGKIPVRESQHDEPSRDPPTPVQEERPGLNSHDTGSKDKISAAEANAPTAKHPQEERQQLQQPKVLTSSTRDSKIPVKHGTQTPQAKEPARTKIPVSKVPVRRAGNKPAGAGGISQVKK